MQPSNVDLLLNRLDAAATGASGGSGTPPEGSSELENEGPPTLTDFLDEDDLLPECRSENTRLIEYLCKQEQILELVKMCTSLPSSDVAEDVATASAAVAAEVNGTPPPRINPVSEAAAKRRYKYPYVASEVLSADIAPLYDAMVNSVLVMDELLGSVETTPEGQLDAFLAGHINKVCVALLSARNEQTLAHMGRRSGFVRALLSHVAVGAIADLLVHLLDAPDREPHQLMYGATEDDAPPFPAALDLLAGADVLRGLANAAVLHALPTSANRKLLASVAELAGKAPPTPREKQPTSLPNGHGSVAGKEGSPVVDGDGAPIDVDAQDHCSSEGTLGSDTIANGDEFAQANGVTPSAAAEDSTGDARAEEAPDSTDVAPGKLRAPAVQASEEAAEVAEESPSSRRMREEALSNAAVAFLGLSHRVLRLPPADVPDALSPYASPSVVSLLVDAGLRASDGPGSAPTLLLQALGVAADLVAAPRAVMQAAAAAEENGVGGGGAQGVGDDGWGVQTAFGEPESDFGAYRGGSGETELHTATPSDADDTTDTMDREATALVADSGAETAATEAEGGVTRDLDIRASVPDASDNTAVDIAGDGVSSPTSSTDPEAESEASKEASALTRALELELSGRFEQLASLLVPPGHAGEETPETVQQQHGLQSAPLTSCQAHMPLGAARLKVAEFFSACLRSAGPDALEVLSACQVPKTLLSLFTRHEWSSMLHGVVSSAIIAAANAAVEHREYALRVWLDADIIGWLVHAWTRASTAPHGEEENGSSISTEDGAPESVDLSASPPPAGTPPGAASLGPRRRQRRDRDVHGNVKFRPGYMGHLIQISSSLRHFLERASNEQADLSGFTPENRELFARFCAESLDDAVALEGRVLGGERPPGGVVSEGEEVFEASRMFDLGGVELQNGEEVSDDLDSSEVVLRLQRMQMPSQDGFGEDDLGGAQTEPTGGDVSGPARGEDTVQLAVNAWASEQPALQQDYDDNEEEEVGSYAAFKRVSRQSATLTPSGDAIATDVPLPRPRRVDGPAQFPPAFLAESREELTNQLIQIAAARQGGAGDSSAQAEGAVAPNSGVDLDVDADTAVTPAEVDNDSPDTGAVETFDGSLRTAAAAVADDDGDAVRSPGASSPPTAVAPEAGAAETAVP
ncbi:hypothetical protein MMPV_002635 [Pyropia vietnamensis]